jgi:hypothetical protein
VDGGINFGGYGSGKYLDDVKGNRRMAGDIFQKKFGDVGWNADLLATNDAVLNVERDPALDYVAAKAKEAAWEKENGGGGASPTGGKTYTK